MTEQLALGIALYLSLIFAVLFFVYCAQRVETRGARSLLVMFLGVIIWIAADIIQYHTVGEQPPAVGISLRLLGPDILVIGALLFALEYTGRDKYLTPLLPTVLIIKPIASQALFFSTYGTDFIELLSREVFIGYDFAMTPLFTVYTLWNWSLVVMSIVLLGHMMFRSHYPRQRQIIILLIAFLTPLAFNVVARGNIFVSDVTSMTFVVTSALFMYATFRLRLMDALPVARQTVLEEIDDLVLILDENGQVVTVNDAAKQTLNGKGTLEGTSVSSVFEIEDNTALREYQSEPLPVSVNGDTLYLDVNRSVLEDFRGNFVAEVLVCRDITETRQQSLKLRDREEDLNLLKDLQSRFLRHNLRNELNVVRAHAQMVLDEDDPEQQQLLEVITDRTDRILDWSVKARAIEQLIEADDTVEYDLNRLVTTVVNDIAPAYEEVTFATDLKTDGRITAVPQLEWALENLLENGAEYNDAENPIVTVETERVEENIEIRVTDNGPGIDAAELKAIRDREEAPLKHGSGFGLWLVYWVVHKSDGELEFESSEDGTTVTLRFEAV